MQCFQLKSPTFSILLATLYVGTGTELCMCVPLIKTRRKFICHFAEKCLVSTVLPIETNYSYAWLLCGKEAFISKMQHKLFTCIDVNLATTDFHAEFQLCRATGNLFKKTLDG